MFSTLNQRFSLTITTALIMVVWITGCGKAASSSGSHLAFTTFGSSSTISLRHSRNAIFNVCSQGATNATVEMWAKRGVLTWLRAARKADDRVTGNVEISCSNPHVMINMLGGRSRSYASPGIVHFYTGQPYGELLHELGHAVAGLGDTYVGSQAGSCAPGQPQSNMCWGAYGPRSDPEKHSGLWPDDITGVMANQRRLFADAKPPANADTINAEAPLNMSSPWGGSMQPSLNPIHPLDTVDPEASIGVSANSCVGHTTKATCAADSKCQWDASYNDCWTQGSEFENAYDGYPESANDMTNPDFASPDFAGSGTGVDSGGDYLGSYYEE